MKLWLRPECTSTISYSPARPVLNSGKEGGLKPAILHYSGPLWSEHCCLGEIRSESNDNWRSDQEGEIIATGIPPTNDLEKSRAEARRLTSKAHSALRSLGKSGAALRTLADYLLQREY